jgi:hypothetical protein
MMASDPLLASYYWLDCVKDFLRESANDRLRVGSDGSCTITGLGEASAKYVERVIGQAQESPSSATRSSFSSRDQVLHDELTKLKGNECFRSFRDFQLIRDHLKNARVVVKDKAMTVGALRACLRRIRRHYGYPPSRRIGTRK